MTLEQNELEIIEPGPIIYEMEMATTNFIQLLSQASLIGSEVLCVQYKSTDDFVHFISKGNSGKVTTCKRSTNDDGMKITKKNMNEIQIVNIYLYLQQMNDLAKGNSLANKSRIKVVIGSNHIILEYDVGTLGYMKIRARDCEKPEDW
jgi:hypothetical protein